MYETELMRQILKSPLAQKMVQEISPRYGAAYVFLWLLQVTGDEWDEMQDWVDDYRLQVVPQTATWALEYWEKAYGITPNPDWSYDRRRQNLLNKLTGKGPMNPKKLEKIAEVAAGFPARVEENTGKNQFTLYITGTPGIVDEAAVITAVKEAKPSRLQFDIGYEVAVSRTQYLGGAIRQLREVTLIQNN